MSKEKKGYWTILWTYQYPVIIDLIEVRIDSTFRKMCKQNCSSMILESENSFHSMKSIKNRPYITTETTRRVVHVHE